MNQHNICTTGDCPQGIEKVRKIGLTPTEKRAIFLSITNLAEVGYSMAKGTSTQAEQKELAA